MSVSLHVKVRDDQSPETVECWLCTSLTTIFDTTIEFHEDSEQFGGICLCVEHMDAIVTGALMRHAAELSLGNGRWFEKAEDDLGDLSAEEERWLQRNSTS